MSESKTVTIPIGLNEGPAQPTQERERPEWARKSLHNVRMPRHEVQLEPVWQDDASIKWREVEQQPAQSYNTFQQQEVSYMEDQSGGQQPQSPQLPQPPDPTSYDFYDGNDVARFHQDNSAYMQSQIDARVQAHLAPHQGALRGAEVQRQINECIARFGDDPNFDEIVKVAAQNVIDSGGKITLEEGYIQADNKSTARPGQKGSAHLPEQLRDKKRGIGSLGRIIEHNHQVGRAKPFGKRIWK